MRYLLLFMLLLWMLAACQGAATPTVEAPRVAAKLLATVYLSPTLGETERQATQRAASPTPSRVPLTPVASPTPYVGVFLGAVEDSAFDSPIVNPALLGVIVTPQTTPGALDCNTAPNEVFGTIWLRSADAVRRLGCPIQIMFGFKGNVQLFERGIMYWREDTGEIWALAPGGPGLGRFWHVAQPPERPTTGIVAPDGQRVPVRGFGSVWLDVPGVADALGFAQTDEERAEFAMQLFESGSLLYDSQSGAVFALIVNGDLYGPFS